MADKPHQFVSFFKTAGGCVWRALNNTIDHDGIEHAGYLTFLALLAFFPFLVLLFSVIGLLGAGETGAAFITQTLELLPANFTAALRPRIVEIVSGPPQGLLTIAIVGALWTASSAVEGLRTILNRAYHVGTPPAYWLRRSLSILQLLVFLFIMVAGILLIIIIPLILNDIEHWLGIYFITDDDARLGHIAWHTALFILFAAVCYIYYLIPNIRQRFISVAPGAAVVVLLWVCAAYFLMLYLSNFNMVNLVYGSLGGLIAAMLFIYISTVIFIFGAALNYEIVHALGLSLVQKEAAEQSVDY